MSDITTSAFNNWFKKMEQECQPVIAWLNDHAVHLANDAKWYLWHSGGGCTHYCADTVLPDGKKVQLMLCHDSVAEPMFCPPSPEPYWALSAQWLNDEGDDYLGHGVLCGAAYDLRDAVLHSSLDRIKWHEA